MGQLDLQTQMKAKVVYFLILFSICFLSICLFGIYLLSKGTPIVHHADPFYDINNSDFPRDHLPLINPVEATQEESSSPWSLKLLNGLHVDLPKSQEQEIVEVYIYYRIEELEKIAVKDNVIMAYSAYVDQQADAYIQNDFYHWFVMVPSQNITKGFHTEDEFRLYIQTFGIQDPDWQTPDETFTKFVDTGGCLDWIPDCK